MFKRVGIISAALATMLVGSSQAGAQWGGTPLYLTHIYSDATHQVEVGYIWGECTGIGIQYHLVGTYTYFQEDELVGYCGGGGPIE